MAKQTFTTGQVLTAAQMTSLQQTAMGGGSATAKTASYTLVAADAGATVIMNSASATTITVNTSLFSAGDTVFIQNIGAGVSTITPGTATVNTSASLALAQYEGGTLYFTSSSASLFFKADGAAAAAASGLTFLNKTTFSAVSSQNVDNIFTSTYENYKIIIELTTCTNQTSINLRFRAAGSTISTSDYSYGEFRYNWNSGGFGGYLAAVNTSLMEVAETASSQPMRANLEVFSPQSSEKPFVFFQSANNAFGLGGSAFTNLTTSFDGFQIFPTAGTMTGSVSVYGYQKS